MFKSARWRSEKNKIKVVFKLQFHATQVPQIGWAALMVSLVPVEVGKPTVRLEKATVRDGTCRWENPIYETVKFVREPKTGKINEKIYQFIVSTGSSKAGLLGEVSIDFANYAETLKPSWVSLPLKTSNTGAILHITIERMHSAIDQSFCGEIEDNGNAINKSHDRSLRSQLSNCDADGNSNRNSTEDGLSNSTISQSAETNGILVACRSSDTTSATSSESSSGRNTPRELGLKNNHIHQDPTSLLSSLSHVSIPEKPIGNTVVTNCQEHWRSNTEWSVDSAPDGSIDDLTNSSEENLTKERSPEASDISVGKLKSDLVVLARQMEVSELELQTLRKQIVKESKKGQDLSREVVSLKEERDALRKEFDQFKATQKRIDEAKVPNKLQFESGDPRALLQEIRQELNYEKDLNANLRLQLQKTQESNSELILAVQDLDEMLEQKNREITYLSNRSTDNDNVQELQETVSKHETEEDEEQQALELLVREHDDAKGSYFLEQKIIDLYGEIDVYRRDKDELEMQMEQLALDYEILKQENHDLLSKLEQNHLQEQLTMQYDCSAPLATINELEAQVESLEKQLEKQEEEFSDSLATIIDLETQVKNLEKELENQAQGFEADLEAVTHAKVEQEQRAIRAEEALRKTRWTNANTAERLQEEFRRLSIQMASTFEANEKLTMKTLMEANELRMQKSHLEELLEKANEELGLVKDYEEKLKKLSSQIDLETKHAEQMFLELKDMSKKLECQKKHEEEMCEALSKEILMLRAEIENLTGEKNDLSEKAEEGGKLRPEMEIMKTSINEAEMQIQIGNAERDELERRVASVIKEADKSLEELNNMRSLKDEKETMVGMLQSEVEILRAQYNDLKRSLFEDEIEKENLRQQVFNLRGDLQKKEDTITATEKKLKDSIERATLLEGTKPTSRNNKSMPLPRGSKEVTGLREKIKLLEGQIKLKEAALENSTNVFLEKEKDLHNRIEELENRMAELDQINTSCEDQFQEKVKDAEKVSVTASKSGGRNAVETLLDTEMGTQAYLPDPNGTTAVIKSNDETCSEKELKVSTSHVCDQGHLDELVNQMAFLKAKNKSMEGELKDMQERYSEISLKFAEVEGERQQLVMTVRNLKNAKKI